MIFQWQSRFYDRIIRDENEMQRIRQYIVNNPSNWDNNNNEGFFI
jgi:REP element-mobilizing transposase RayT